jgi:hypothetical protein
VGGGQDQQLAEIRAKEAQRQDFVGRYSKALTGTPQEQLAEGQAMINAGYHEYGGKLAALGMQSQKDENERKAALEQGKEVTTQVTGAQLNAQIEGANFDPQAVYNRNAKGGYSRVGGSQTDPVDTVTPSITSKEITEAYGVKAGTPEHQELMQTALDIGPKLTVTDVKTIRADWNTTTKEHREAIDTADQVIALTSMAHLSDDPEQISIVADRLVSRMFGGSDAKAQAEMNAFRSSGSFGKRIADAASNFLSGKYTKDTFEGFKKLAAFTKNRNIVAYNKKLKGATDSFALSDNLTQAQANTLLGEPLKKSSISPAVSKGSEMIIDGIEYVFKGGQSNDLSNWVVK